MSIYDNRDSSAYVFRNEKPYRNRNIEKWWNNTHDKIIERLIDEYQWYWFWEVSDAIIEATPREVADVLCQQHAWYNKVMKYARTRAQELGLTKRIRKPEKKECLVCHNEFVEDSLPYPLAKRTGIDSIDFCAPCLGGAVLRNKGNSEATKEEVISYLVELSSLLCRVPQQEFGRGIEDILSIERDKRQGVVDALRMKPTTKRVKELFGSWLKALIEAGILESETRETRRGIQTIAEDGDVCLSLGERTIDDYLFRNGIAHTREPRYPDSNYRADFLVGETFIEYFGLQGDPDYDKKSKIKERICSEHGIRFLAIYPKDLISVARLRRKLTEIISDANLEPN